MKSFKPMLAPNEKVNVEDMKFPLLVSFKLDGIRCIFKDGQMYSRALKQFPNVQLYKRFEKLMRLSKELDVIFDGELLAKSLTFNELSGLTRQLDKELPDDLYFYGFDCIVKSNFTKPFKDRLVDLQGIKLIPVVKIIEQYEIVENDKVKQIFQEALAWGCDGLILRNPNSHYKFGRGTVKEALIYKLKPFETFDAQIIDVIQGTKVIDDTKDMLQRLIDEGVLGEGTELEDSEIESLYQKRYGELRKINELGRSVTSKKKGDRILIDKACDFLVLYDGKEIKVAIAKTDEEKEEIWKNRKSYIGRWIEYKGMKVGMKDVPRHPVLERFRDDKEE